MLLAVCGVKNFRISVKTLFFLVLLGISAFEPGFSVFGENWVLAGQKFSFAQKGTESSASARLAEVLPQLILEQVAENSIRSVSAQEQLDRELYSLQTEIWLATLFHRIVNDLSDGGCLFYGFIIAQQVSYLCFVVTYLF